MTDYTRRTYPLPDGTPTNNVEFFQDEWHKIIDPICEILGATLSSYCPGITLIMKSGEIVQFSVDVAQRILKAVNKKTEVQE